MDVFDRWKITLKNLLKKTIYFMFLNKEGLNKWKKISKYFIIMEIFSIFVWNNKI